MPSPTETGLAVNAEEIGGVGAWGERGKVVVSETLAKRLCLCTYVKHELTALV